MLTKSTGRLNKLASSPVEQFTAVIATKLSPIRESIQSRWNLREENCRHTFDLSPLSTVNYEEDSLINLPRLDVYIDDMRRRQVGNAEQYIQQARQLSQLLQVLQEPYYLALPGLPSMETESAQDAGHLLSMTMASVEHWLYNLEVWARSEVQRPSEATCTKLAAFLTAYNDITSKLYQDDPQSLSRAALNALRLFIVLDEIMLAIHPMLADYNPDIDVSQLQHLQLVDIEQQQQLDTVVSYFHRRDDKKLHFQHIFDLALDDESLSVKLFIQSQKHFDLMGQIERMAVTGRGVKLEEFRQRSGWAESQRRIRERIPHLQHSNGACTPACPACSGLRALDAEEIRVYEEPLPEHLPTARAMVYNLQMDESIAAWRESILQIRLGVFKETLPAGTRHSTRFRLPDNPQLTPFYVAPKTPQSFLLCSGLKLTEQTHRATVRLKDLRQEQLFVANGYRYLSVHITEGLSPQNMEPSDYVRTLCTHSIATPTLRSVIYPSRRPEHPQGHLLNVRDIPGQPGLPPHEAELLYHSLLTYDSRLRRFALLMKARAFNLNTSEALLGLMQALYEAGPSAKQSDFPQSAATRVPHVHLADRSFALGFLATLRELYADVEPHEGNCNILLLLILSAARIHNVSTEVDIQIACEQFLDEVRTATFTWFKALLGSPSARGSTSFLIHSALLVMMTLDLHNRIEVVMSQGDNTATALSCIILLHREQQMLPPKDPIMAIIYRRYTRLVWRLHLLLYVPEALNTAVSLFWPHFTHNGTWSDLGNTEPEIPHQQIYSKQDGDQTAILGVLTGQLLINGRPIGKLPINCTTHSQYIKLFGQESLDVTSHKANGLLFQSTRPYQTWWFSFGWNSAREFVIRRARQEPEPSCFELLEPTTFSGVLPSSLIADHVHWLDTNTGRVHFCAIDDPFGQPVWVLETTPQGRNLSGQLGIVLPTTSQTVNMLHNVFSHLTRVEELFVSCPHGENFGINLAVTNLPRLRFEVKYDSSGEYKIVSQDFPGQYISTKPLLTLIDHKAKLLLENDRGEERLLLAEVAAPRLGPSKEGSQPAYQAPPQVHSYKVNRSLKELRPDGHDVQSVLYLAYAHATSSSFLPDSLTGRTGVEMALQLLSSAAVQALQKLTPANKDILQRIADLTPVRKYYPEDLVGMQHVLWDAHESVMAQVADFDLLIQWLQDQWAGHESLTTTTEDLTFWRSQSETMLLERDTLRRAVKVLYDREGGVPIERHDRFYGGRLVPGSQYSTENVAAVARSLQD